MNKRLSQVAAAIILSSTLFACSGTGSLSVANPIPGIQSYLASLSANGSAKAAVTDTSANTTVQQQAGTDLQPYRSEFDATLNVWVVYYYSPSKNKSYKCKPNADKTVTVTEVTDTTLIYTQGDNIDVTQVNVDAAAAAQTAVTTAASPSPSPTATATATPAATGSATPTAAPTATPTASPSTASGSTTVTTSTVTSVTLISAGEARSKHHRAASNPVYVVVTSTQTVYVDAKTGTTVTTSSDTSTSVSTGTGSATTNVGASTATSTTVSI